MRKSRPVVLVVGLLLITVLVLSVSGCGKSKRRTHTNSPRAAATTSAKPFYSCEEAWAAGKAPLRRSDSGYSASLDRLDGREDGTACAVRPTSTNRPKPTTTARPTTTRR